MNTSIPLIAVVDDEESIRKALERLVRAAGLSAKTFPDGGEFLHFLQTVRPDCVVLDLHMPGANGFVVLEQMAKAGFSLPVIVITGDESEETQARVMQSGVKFCLQKPVDGQLLLDAIAPAIQAAAQGAP
jgi:FixJ family two-component response regulator